MTLDPASSNPDSRSIPDPGPEDEINQRDLLLVLAKNWKMIIVVPFVVAVITAIFTLFMPNIYTVKAMILPSDDSGDGMMSAMMGLLGGLAGIVGGGLGGAIESTAPTLWFMQYLIAGEIQFGRENA